MDMPALTASCVQAAKAYCRADMWCGKITVEHHMVKTPSKRAHFLRWWFSVCSSPGLHIELWFALRPLMVMNTEAFDQISSAVLMIDCSHDLFCRGFCMTKAGCLEDPVAVQLLLEQEESTSPISVSDDDAYGIITDGPVPSGPFSFTVSVYHRACDGPNEELYVECCVGYIPWPPTPSFFSRSDTLLDRPVWGSLHVMGGLHMFINEDDLKGNTATFQVSVSSGKALQVRNLSLPKQVIVHHHRGSTLTSPTGTYAFYFLSNCNSCSLSLCIEGVANSRHNASLVTTFEQTVA